MGVVEDLVGQLEQGWQDAISGFMQLPAADGQTETPLQRLNHILGANPINYHPEGETIFAALHAVPFNKVRVVIIGQDPYSRPDDATGIAFSTPIGRPMTKSVTGIYCSIASDLGGKIPIHGNLDHLTKQGVLLLNRVLTFCDDGEDTNAHRNKGWEIFTEAVVKALSDNKRRRLHFMLWGGEARNLEVHIDGNFHNILPRTNHPAAPIFKDAAKFRTCYHFSKVNKALLKNFSCPIKWMPRYSRGFFEICSDKPRPPRDLD